MNAWSERRTIYDIPVAVALVIGGIASVFAGYPMAAFLFFAIFVLLLAHAVNHPVFLLIAIAAVLFFLGIGGWLDFEGWRFLPRSPLDGSP